MNPFLNIIEKTDKKVIVGLTDEVKALEIIRRFQEKSVLVVTNSLYEANTFYKILQNYTSDVLLFPMDDFLTSEALAISPEFKYKRLESLTLLLSKKKYIVVTNLMGYLRFLPNKKIFQEKNIYLKINEVYNRKELEEALFDLGYEKQSIVSRTGEMSSRGFIVDVFSISYDFPIRIEFWGDEITSIRFFDVDSQLAIQTVQEISIGSNTEFLAEKDVPFSEKSQKNLSKYTKVSSICDYLEEYELIFINFHDIQIGYQNLEEEIFEYKKSIGASPNQKYMHTFSTTSSAIYLSDFEDTFSENEILRKKILELDTFPTVPADILLLLNSYLAKNKKVYICVDNRYSANKILETFDTPSIVFTNLDTYIEKKINLVLFKMDSGFESEDYVVITEREIFHKKSNHYKFKSKFKMGTKIKDINKLNVGDYVVHHLHGIGRYAGIKTLPKNGLRKDYLMIEYASSDKLYIPVEKIEFINKYSSSDGVVPKLNKLGSTEWQKTKLRAKKRIESIAEDLLKLYAERENIKGISFLEDTKDQYLFQRDFPYELTKDQVKVIEEVKSDMEKQTPMDRLLCGDVGFGKTEVAFRAVFKAIMSGYQAALLCPTTILSNQHFQNACERFRNFGVEIRLLNRFVTGNKLKQILVGLKEGKIDFVIGTHKLLGKDVIFKNLGLLVVDEEQRFGVKHKEKIKTYKNNIDVLTLSATPIPRTLQMSMSGLRSLSLIETPPINRYPVQTYVLAENNGVIKDVIYKELSRNGQVFLLYNHVDSIAAKAAEISNLVPSARVIYAHGRMSKADLENVMIAFTNHEYDVLICTTIIETGIDIQNVNTLIILDADYFGLSQLYQIRGRVGRTDKIAYAYLMYNQSKILSEIAIKRLKVIKDFTELGSGFSIAMRDLSIRGAGDILGSEQAGFIDTIGIEMFMTMLNEEVARLKGEKIVEKDQIQEHSLVDVETTIEDQFVDDNDLKIQLHKQINEIDSYEKLIQVKEEIEDRYGKISESLLIYMHEEWFEKLAQNLHIDTIRQTKNFIEITIPSSLTSKLDGQKLFLDVSNLSRMFRFRMRGKNLIIILDIVKLEKHFIYYLISLLQIIEKSKKELI